MQPNGVDNDTLQPNGVNKDTLENGHGGNSSMQIKRWSDMKTGV